MAEAEVLTESEQPTLQQRLLQMRTQLIESLEAESSLRLLPFNHHKELLVRTPIL
jgi:hypothetical protein